MRLKRLQFAGESGDPGCRPCRTARLACRRLGRLEAENNGPDDNVAADADFRSLAKWRLLVAQILLDGDQVLM
jgi:hypothetical protein